ncbi:MAG: hypothetical protein ACXWKO_03330 [Phenylobacterium sp.]
MLALVLALMAAAPPSPAAGGNTVSPVTVQPAAKPPEADLKIQMQGSEDDIDQLVVIWPSTAYQARLDGRVTLRCKVDTHGLAEWCEVASETPAGKGFGKAALEMRTTFVLPIPMGPDGPINAMKTVSLTFKAPDTQVDLGNQAIGKDTIDMSKVTISGNGLQMRKVTMLDYPVWAQAANFDDLARAYPAKGGGVEGYAVAHCQVQRSGALTGCQLIKETPDHREFGKAALGLAATKFRVAPELATKPHPSPLWVDVPIRMPPPAALADRTVTAPVWISGVDLKVAPKVFPPEAAAQGLSTGRGVVRCRVTPEGTMTQCAPETADPDGLGFSEAAAKLATTMRMNLWSADGAPVEGGIVHIAIRLNLKAGG